MSRVEILRNSVFFSPHILRGILLAAVVFFYSPDVAGQTNFVQKIELSNCATEGAGATVSWTDGKIDKVELSAAASYSYQTVNLAFSEPDAGHLVLSRRFHDGSFLRLESEFSYRQDRLALSSMIAMDHGSLLDRISSLLVDVIKLASSNPERSKLYYDCKIK